MNELYLAIESESKRREIKECYEYKKTIGKVLKYKRKNIKK